MQHLNTRFCGCGREMTVYDKTGQLQRNHQRQLFGGNVEAFTDADCPDCGRKYRLWLRQHRNAWQVVTMSSNDPVGEEASLAEPEGDEFDQMERDELKVYLDGLGIEYTANWGEKRLRELCRNANKGDGE